MGASPVTTAFLLILFCALDEASVHSRTTYPTGVHGSECPEDSLPNENGGECICKSVCPVHECPPGKRRVMVRPAAPDTPGSCCPVYDCATSGFQGSESCPDDSVPTDDGGCKCVPTCPTPTCEPGQRPVQVRPAINETPGSCCPLYDCVTSESVSWVETEEGNVPGNCLDQGVSRKLGERWKRSPCDSCVCENGLVACQTAMCKTCENFIPPGPDECCPHCPPFTNSTTIVDQENCQDSLNGCHILACAHGYVHDKNNCPTCQCATRKETVDHATLSSLDDDEICPELTHCKLTCDLAKDEGGCSVCACQVPPTHVNQGNGTSNLDLEEDQRESRICPSLKCDLHCERGLVMDDNDCTICECKPSHDGCPLMINCKKNCAFGYKTNRRGCPICRCRASCTDHLNQTHPEGATWYPNTCTKCACHLGGKLTCKETICSVGCDEPLPPKSGACCPYCPIVTSKGKETITLRVGRGWGTAPITLICILTLLCLLLIVHIVRNRFRGRLSPSVASYSAYPPQYYKCVPAYDTPAHRSEKIVPL